MLATLAARIDPAAERMAIETALETGARLLVANVVRLPPYRVSLALHGPSGAVLPHEDAREAVRAAAQRAADLGLETELLKVFSKHPSRALGEVARERDVALVVVGPDASRVRRFAIRRAVRSLRDANCLVWVAPDGFLD
jgi:nucleotide-binding universal stress UspA family protein